MKKTTLCAVLLLPKTADYAQGEQSNYPEEITN